MASLKQKDLDAPPGAPIVRALTTARVADIGRKIDEVLCGPETRDELRDLVCLLAARQMEGLALIVQRATPAEVTRNLRPAEAAKILGKTVRWLYDHASELDCTRRVGGSLLFDSIGVERLRDSRR